MLKLYGHYKNAAAALERKFLKDDTGQTMVEYVMLIVLVALAVFLLTPNIKSAILQVFSNTSSALK
jgi:Flp pilus assembly pilin Flp